MCVVCCIAWLSLVRYEKRERSRTRTVKFSGKDSDVSFSLQLAVSVNHAVIGANGTLIRRILPTILVILSALWGGAAAQW